MTVAGGGKALHEIIKLSRGDVGCIVRGMATHRQAEPAIVVDVSILLFALKQVNTIAQYLIDLASLGVTVIPVCDNNARPNVKQETIKRYAKRERARIEELVLRRQIRIMKRRFNNESFTNEERLKLLADVNELETKRKRKETASYRRTIPNLDVELERELEMMCAHSTNSAGGCVREVVTAQFQADTYMAGQVRSKNAVMVLSTDTDIPVITGDCCISIKGCSKNDFSLTSTSKTTLATAMSFLPSSTKASMKVADFPIFEGVNKLRLRALMMLLLGCDVYPSGCKNVGLKTLSKKIEGLQAVDEDGLYKYLLGMMKKEFQPHLTEMATARGVEKEDLKATVDLEAEDVVQTYLDALVYEPANKYGDKTLYIGGDSPVKLAKYCEQFASREANSATEIYPGPTILTCTSAGGREHNFLAAGGSSKCAKCNNIVCTFCQITIGENKRIHCLTCGAGEQLVPDSGANAAEPIESKRNRLLQEYHFSEANNLTSDEVEDALELLDFIRDFRAQGQTVPFPLYPSKEMSGGSDKMIDIVEILLNGGQFLGDSSIKEKHIPGILELFAAVVTFALPDEKHTKWKKDSAIYDSLPKILIDFASKSRVDSGHRLLSRCVRHALDSKCPSLQNNIATLIQHGDEIGIRINSAVPASMQKKVYKPGVVFTATEVLCCECNCHCGSEHNERVVCVHIFPLIFLLSLLIMDALGESILMEFAACLRSDIWDEDLFSEEDMMSMKKSIVTLADAAGDFMSDIDLRSITIHELMDKFETGTEGRKLWKQRCKTKPKPSEHCCIVDIGRFSSTAAEAKKRTARRKDASALLPLEQDETVGDVSVGSEHSGKVPEYVTADLLINAAGFGDVLASNSIGWKLFQLRAIKQRAELGIDNRAIISQTKSLEKKWDELIKLGNKRSHRAGGKRQVQQGTTASSSTSPLPTTTTQDTNTSTSTTTFEPQEPLLVTPSPKVLRRPSQKSSSKKRKRVNKSQPPKPQQKNTKSQKLRRRRPGQNLPSQSSPKPPRRSKRLNKSELPTPKASKHQTPQPKKKRVFRSHECCKKGCGNNNINCPPGTKWLWVPMPKQPPKSKKPSKKSLINNAGSVLLRQEIMDRTMSDRYNVQKRPRYCVCSNHMFEKVRKTKQVKLNNGEAIHVTYELVVPSGAGLSLEPTTLSKGNGNDRGVVRLLNAIEDKDESWAMCTQKVAEDSDQTNVPINATVAAAANIPIAFGNADEFTLPGTKFFRFTQITNTVNRQWKAEESPSVKPGMSDKEVKRRTGFPSESLMLAYIIVICDGDVEKMKMKQTVLTWYEEWFMFFEYVWNRSINRLEDVKNAFSELREADILRAFDAKLDMCSEARKSWPMFATFEEDKALQKEKWSSRYDGMRPVMWDMTNLSAYSFTNADYQRLTYSSYYNENCFKAGVFCQPCGWMGVSDAWTGGVSDTDFNRRAGYLRQQHQFQESDLVTIDGVQRVIVFLNIYDKGYRPKMAAWENGKQLVLQPDFKDSDKKFNRDQTISSASVASDRGGNERAVNVSKRAGFISKGFLPNSDPIRFNSVWRNWSFQANFMFDPVL